ASDTQSSGELSAPGESGVHGDVDAVEHLAPPAVIGRLRAEVLRDAEERRLHVIEAAQLLPAAWQPPVGRYGDAEGIVVGRGRRQVVGDEEVLIPGAEVPHVE